MRNNKEKLPLKYSTRTILKRVFKYALKKHSILAVSIVFLIIFSVLEIFQPLIIKKIIDDELSSSSRLGRNNSKRRNHYLVVSSIRKMMAP